MFWALNGATRRPSLASHRHRPAVTMLLPASDVVPATNSAPPLTACSVDAPGLTSMLTGRLTGQSTGPPMRLRRHPLTG